MTASASVGGRRLPVFLTASLARELGVLLALSVMFPFMVHLLPVPEDRQLGPRLLPIFYAPLLAALLGRVRTAVVVALAAPWLNWLLTSHPTPIGAVTMTVELGAFVAAIELMLSRWGARWYFAAVAYLAAKMVAALVVACLPALVGGQPALNWAVAGVVTGVPGIAILLLINWLVLRFYPPGNSSGGTPMAA